ncbi:MAG: hypothetical protein H6828_15920 [Planctomycetes bacterium]|nr:hypothetical protein [Planctomycetota bacterium]
MFATRKTFAVLAVVLALAAGTTAVMRSVRDDGPPPLPADPSALPVTVVGVWPFTLDEPATYWCRAERPQYDAGLILVLSADPELLHPRQAAEPVLYVGAQTAEKLNTGYPSGQLVALVPAPRGSDGQPVLDLSQAPIFFGQPDLPERVDAARVSAELAEALSKGVGAESSSALATREHELVNFPDDGDLRAWSADLIERFSPQEVDLVSGLRAPRLRR